MMRRRRIEVVIETRERTVIRMTRHRTRSSHSLPDKVIAAPFGCEKRDVMTREPDDDQREKNRQEP